MELNDILKNKELKAMDKRKQVVKYIVENQYTCNALNLNLSANSDKEIAIVLEALEEITNQLAEKLDVSYLAFAEKYLSSSNNSCKREAARILGNLAVYYPSEIQHAIPLLIVNTKDESTVVRWSSAYALSRIIEIETIAKTNLFQELEIICQLEKENGVKNQYVKSLKKASKIRRNL